MMLLSEAPETKHLSIPTCAVTMHKDRCPGRLPLHFLSWFSCWVEPVLRHCTVLTVQWSVRVQCYQSSRSLTAQLPSQGAQVHQMRA